MRSPIRIRRIVGGAAAALACAAALTGCSAAPSGDGSAELSLMIWDPAQTAGVQRAVDGFEAANPDISVTLQQVPQDQYYTKLDASLGAGEGPDVMWQSSLVSQYAEGGALEPLDDYIAESGLNLEDYSQEISDLYKLDGTQYGIAKDQDTWTFVYNTAVFEKLGVTDVPTNDWTWDDMVDIAEQVQAKQTGATDIPMAYDRTFNNGVASIAHQLGGKIIDGGKSVVSSPEGIEALSMVKELQDKQLIPKVADSTDFNAVTSLISGTIAMAEIPSWNLSLLTQADVPAGTFSVVRLPAVNGSWTTDTNGLAYVMNANSKEKDAAWTLIEYLTSTEGAKLQAEGGASIPANTDPATREAYVSANKALEGLSEAIGASQSQTYLRTSSAYPATRAVLPELEATQMGPFYAGDITAEAAAAGIDEILTESLG